jgi:TruD family tRNA pseudouridine synthase
MTMIISPEERENERALFEAERQRVPELFLRAPMIDDEACLRSIGIENVYGDLPVGYLKLWPQDFIVEEVSREGNVCSVDAEGLDVNRADEGGTFYADLVKLGASTLEAKAYLSQMLGIDEKNISYAGIKDKAALTSQAISIRGLGDAEKILAVEADNFFLKNIRRGKGVVANGDLKGNRFTITVRPPAPIGPAIQKDIEQKLEVARAEGFWNFFYTQRFGTPRLISHRLGCLLVKGNYEEVVKMFCTYTGPRELPYFKAIREEVAAQWGNWAAIKEILDRFPYHFSNERAFIYYLAEHPGDFLGALHELPDQIRLWFYAYDSYLFNRKMSECIRAGSVPLRLPFLTSFNPADWEPYTAFLKEDGVRMPSRSYRDFPFVRVESRTCITLQPLEIHEVAVKDRVVVFSFSLPKGSYATSFLMGFFMLASGLPFTPNISMETVDAKQILGTGTIAPVLERFRKVLEQRQADLEGSILEE